MKPSFTTRSVLRDYSLDFYKMKFSNSLLLKIRKEYIHYHPCKWIDRDMRRQTPFKSLF